MSRSDIVLVVDDEAAVRSALKFALELEGFIVRVYDGPVALLGEANLPACSCMIVDYRMPVIDGLELVSMLRSRGASAPAVIITGRSSKELQAQAEKIGVHKVLEKPLANGVLVAAVHSAIGA
jgi:FixJ family two-component response regulator